MWWWWWWPFIVITVVLSTNKHLVYKKQANKRNIPRGSRQVMSQAPATPVIPFLAQPCPLPIVCMLMMVAVCHHHHCGSHNGSQLESLNFLIKLMLMFQHVT